MSFTQTIRKTLVMLTPTGKEIRAPEQIIHPQSRDDAAFFEARKGVKWGNPTGKASS